MMIAEICDVETGFSRMKTGYYCLRWDRFLMENLRTNFQEATVFGAQSHRGIARHNDPAETVYEGK